MYCFTERGSLESYLPVLWLTRLGTGRIYLAYGQCDVRQKKKVKVNELNSFLR